MSKKVFFMDRWNAKKLHLNPETDCLISVNDNQKEADQISEIHEEALFKSALLPIVFSDIDDKSEFSIDDYKAKLICNFVEKNSNKTNFYVHCFAGVSRSAAIAKFIDDYFVINDMRLQGYSMYNRYVYNMLMGVSGSSLKSYYEALEQQERKDPDV